MTGKNTFSDIQNDLGCHLDDEDPLSTHGPRAHCEKNRQSRQGAQLTVWTRASVAGDSVLLQSHFSTLLRHLTGRVAGLGLEYSSLASPIALGSAHTGPSSARSINLY